MDRRLAATGALAGALAVAAGAFGAHALKDRLGGPDLAVFETAVRWHALHAVAVLCVAQGVRAPGRALRAAGFAFLAGVLLFSGSLYALALGAPRGLGAVTPIGGALWIAGWVLAAVGFLRAPPPDGGGT
jgi:uncharacterized membrane protein YgdD (TMEM256/DUF423 family)